MSEKMIDSRHDTHSQALHIFDRVIGSCLKKKWTSAEDLGSLIQPPVARGSVRMVLIAVCSGLWPAAGPTAGAGGLTTSSSSSPETFSRWKNSPSSAAFSRNR